MPTLTPLAVFLSSLLSIVNHFVIPLLIAGAIVFFFWGLIKYIRNPEDENRKVLIAGIISLVVMVCLWGIILLIGNAFGITGVNNNTGGLQIPQVGQTF